MCSAHSWRNLSESRKRRGKSQSDRHRVGRRTRHGGMHAIRLTCASILWLSRVAARRFFARLRDVRSWNVGRSHLAFVHDVAMALLAFIVALCLKFGLNFVSTYPGPAIEGSVYVAAAAAVVFWSMRLSRSLWCYASLQDMVTIAKAVTLVSALFFPFWALSPRLSIVPVETLVINWFVMAALLAGPRLVSRLFTRRAAFAVKERRRYGRVPLILVGTGDNTELFLRALARDPLTRYRVIGMVDEMGAYLRGSIHGVEVLGNVNELKAVVDKLEKRGERPQRLVVTEQSLSPSTMRALLDEAAQLGMTLSRTPRLTELTDGVTERVEVKPVAIEDLLGRPQTVLDQDSMRALIHNANVLITGAGGSIGSELVRQISDFAPAHLALLDNSELHLYQIDLELQKRHPDLPRATIMADVRDGARIREIMATHRPALVFHAAAMKHVPMVEMHPCEGVLTNVIGTRNVADSCLEFGVKTMVLISTDKAVNPTSVMGATKRIAESYCQSLDVKDNDQDGSTRFVTVRFGNVLGSTGSVVPLFQRQLAAGGPLTVTDPNVTRYFMTVSEAVGLVLQASALGSQFTDRIGTIFVLEMGDPVRISDLANQMIRLAGFIPGKDIEVVFTGLRPGEKLFEEPLHISEELRPTESNGILLASPRIADETVLNSLIDELAQSAQAKNTVRARALMHQLIPEYQPSTGGSVTVSDQSPANGLSDTEDTPVASATATIAKFSEHAKRQRAAR